MFFRNKNDRTSLCFRSKGSGPCSCTILIFLLYAAIGSNLPAADFDIEGQASGWITSNPDMATQIGLRYIPDIMISTDAGENLIDGEFSLNMYGLSQYTHATDSIFFQNDLSAYRLWLRLSGLQYEFRIGLQKINFGSAILLRPLMWFDSIDPRDPLQLTDGVYGILARYYFLNNANIWLWGLYGNDQTRGWEIFTSDKHKPEFGGRVQVPLLTGEIALTFHHRWINIRDQFQGASLALQSDLAENRIGLDGKWDIGIGIWFEAVLSHRNLDYKPLSYQRTTNVGADYTFDIGNGLGLIMEYFTMSMSDRAFGSGEDISLTALSVNYPLGLLDNLTGMVYFESDQNNWYRFFSWQRTYDNWRFYLMGFWNPDQYQLYQTGLENNLYAGKGIQFLVVFNH